MGGMKLKFKGEEKPKKSSKKRKQREEEVVDNTQVQDDGEVDGRCGTSALVLFF
jgi:hypothetical protein